MRIHFQEYDNNDKAFIWKTYVNAMKPHIEKIWGWDQSWQENDFNLGLKQCKTEVIFVDGCVAGYLQTEQKGNALFIRMLILIPEYQSKGIGTKILDMLQPLTSGNLLKLNCFKINKNAYRFYKKSGFDEIKTDENYIYLQRHTNA